MKRILELSTKIDVSNALNIWYIYNDLRLGFYEDIISNYHTYDIPSFKICFYKNIV